VFDDLFINIMSCLFAGVLSVFFLVIFTVYKAAKWGVHLELAVTSSSDEPYFPGRVSVLYTVHANIYRVFSMY
jgi:hypothetical protein